MNCGNVAAAAPAKLVIVRFPPKAEPTALVQGRQEPAGSPEANGGVGEHLAQNLRVPQLDLARADPALSLANLLHLFCQRSVHGMASVPRCPTPGQPGLAVRFCLGSDHLSLLQPLRHERMRDVAVASSVNVWAHFPSPGPKVAFQFDESVEVSKNLPLKGVRVAVASRRAPALLPPVRLGTPAAFFGVLCTCGRSLRCHILTHVARRFGAVDLKTTRSTRPQQREGVC